MQGRRETQELDVSQEESKPLEQEAEKPKLIEFYVPDRHVKSTRWVPESLRGQIIEFPAPLKKPA